MTSATVTNATANQPTTARIAEIAVRLPRTKLKGFIIAANEAARNEAMCAKHEAYELDKYLCNLEVF